MWIHNSKKKKSEWWDKKSQLPFFYPWQKTKTELWEVNSKLQESQDLFILINSYLVIMTFFSEPQENTSEL